MSPLLLYLTRTLSIEWRKRLTEHMFGLYFKAQGYYATNSLFSDINQSDQRLAEDLQRVRILQTSFFRLILAFIHMTVRVSVCL